MEQELIKKLHEMYSISAYYNHINVLIYNLFRKDRQKGTIGILLVDKLGLPIESNGDFDTV